MRAAMASGAEVGPMSKTPVTEAASDWVRRPGMGFVWWCFPLGVAIAANFFASPHATALVWVVSFAWMGTGCVLNARRKRRVK